MNLHKKALIWTNNISLKPWTEFMIEETMNIKKGHLQLTYVTILKLIL